MKSSNPIFKRANSQYENYYNGDDLAVQNESVLSQEQGTLVGTASFKGVIIKTVLMTVLMVLIGVGAAWLLYTGHISFNLMIGLMIGSIVVVLITAVLGVFFEKLAVPCTIIYAVAQGIFLGMFTGILNLLVPGIGILAGLATAIIFVAMLVLYSIKAIRVTKTFTKIMITISFALLIFFPLSFIISPVIVSSSGTGIVISILASVFLIGYGAFMLVWDFDTAKTITENNPNKRVEWIATLGILVSLVWIYLRIIELIIKIALLFGSKK